MVKVTRPLLLVPAKSSAVCFVPAVKPVVALKPSTVASLLLNETVTAAPVAGVNTMLVKPAVLVKYSLAVVSLISLSRIAANN
ncbi:hypothetical protein D3C85_1397160 [compost metagenome]